MLINQWHVNIAAAHERPRLPLEPETSARAREMLEILRRRNASDFPEIAASA
jgi:hypothetical protein